MIDHKISWDIKSASILRNIAKFTLYSTKSEIMHITSGIPLYVNLGILAVVYNANFDYKLISKQF